MGLFDTDPIITSSGAAAPATPAAAAGDEALCRDPGSGKPDYDRVVLDTLHGSGRISRTAYRRVVAGSLSIEDLNITPAELARLRCEGTGEVCPYDEHFDPGFPPSILASAAITLSAVFTAQHLPTDKAHRITVTVPAGSTLASGQLVARVDFGTQYVDPESGLAVAPVVTVSPIGGAEAWRVENISSTGYYLYSDSGLAAASTSNLQVLVEPARR